jgi:hypothetical protein
MSETAFVTLDEAWHVARRVVVAALGYSRVGRHIANFSKRRREANPGLGPSAGNITGPARRPEFVAVTYRFGGDWQDPAAT